MIAEKILSNIQIIPNDFGVYYFIGIDNEILYIGKARNLQKRLKNYLSPSVSAKTKAMLSLAVDLKWSICKSEADSILFEASQIKTLRPRYNILLKDDKSFPEIFVDIYSEFPSFKIHKGRKQKNGAYFGPFANRENVKLVLDILQKTFLFRDCSDHEFKSRTKPCLKYHIKRCSAPCVNKVTKNQYDKQIKGAMEILSDDWSSLKKKMTDKMSEYVQEMKYEQAAITRDRLKALNDITFNVSNNVFNAKNDIDVIVFLWQEGMICLQVTFIRNGNNYGSTYMFPKVFDLDQNNREDIVISVIMQFYQDNMAPKQIMINDCLEKHNLDLLTSALKAKTKQGLKIICPIKGSSKDFMSSLEQDALEAMKRNINEKTSINDCLINLKEIFSLKEKPRRIEVFDNSHNHGSHSVGAMIVAAENGFDKSQYRQYSFSVDHNGDDYGAMREMLKRRLIALKESLKKDKNAIKPDLWLVDGGKGQLSVAMKVQQEMNLFIPVVAIAKGVDRNSGLESFHHFSKGEIEIPVKDKTRFYLQNIRDEAHRFAITKYRKQHLKSTMASVLDSLPNVGIKRKQKLLEFFGSVDGLKNASIEQILRVDGISTKTASAIFNFLKSID